MKFDRKTVRALTDKIVAGIKAPKGCTVEAGGASYDSAEITLKIKIKLEGAVTRDAKQYVAQVALDNKIGGRLAGCPEKFGFSFMHGGELYKMVEYKPRATVNAFICENESGQKYRFPTSLIKTVDAF